MASVGTNSLKRTEKDDVKARRRILALECKNKYGGHQGSGEALNPAWERAAPTTSVVEVRILRLNEIPFLPVTKGSSEAM